ncbi:hypothetical protein [Syntrophomonas palmitatica]|nr:hypothetical protein [Syntrophomonas palmitatica]
MKSDKFKNRMMPDASVLDGIPAHNPHEEFMKMDTEFKRSRGAQR